MSQKLSDARRPASGLEATWWASASRAAFRAALSIAAARCRLRTGNSSSCSAVVAVVSTNVQVKSQTSKRRAMMIA